MHSQVSLNPVLIEIETLIVLEIWLLLLLSYLDNKNGK